MLSLMKEFFRIFITDLGTYDLIKMEAIAVLGLILLALGVPRRRSPQFRRIEQVLSQVSRRRGLSVCVIGAFALLAHLALVPLIGIPEPLIHDEFSYLLAADTFASGRLTNPPHPLWVHFETFHVIFQPSYASMYTPGPGIVLAAGKLLFGHPIVAVWLTAAGLCAAICWMLQGWLPPQWALLGGALAALRIGLFSYWANSYWGGALAGIGGALLLGAFPRIHRSGKMRDAVLMGIGVAILANTRPYEGMLLCLPVAAGLLHWMWGKRAVLWGPPLRRVVAPLALVISIAAGATGYYNWRVTGNPMRMPYQINRDTYAVGHHFIWQPLGPEPAYHHTVMRQFFTGREIDGYPSSHSLHDFIVLLLEKIRNTWLFFLGPVLTLPLLAFPCCWRDRRIRFLLFTLVFWIAGVSLVGWGLVPHYVAPVTALLFAVIVQCMRHLRVWRWSARPAGQFLVRAIPLVGLVMIAIRICAMPLGIEYIAWPPSWYTLLNNPEHPRQRIVEKLHGSGERHLVLVRYSRDHLAQNEWVYNEPDIDASGIVWARDMSETANRELLQYYKHRRVWLLEPDYDPPLLKQIAEPRP